MKHTIKLLDDFDWDTYSFYNEFLGQLSRDNIDEDIFTDSSGNLWELRYDYNSYGTGPLNWRLYGPVEKKTKEVTYYE